MLELERVGVDDNFFELGGHSLLATQIVSRIRETLQVDLALRDLFEAPTVAGLVERITDRLGDGLAPRGAPIERHGHGGPARLSFSQERMWFLNRLAPESAAYNVPAAVRIRGPLNLDALVAALRDVVRRHELLGAVFPMMDGRPVQVVTGEQVSMPLVDLQGEPAASREARARDILREESRRSFDLIRGPVFRMLVVRLAAADHILLLNMHHIVTDHWSFGVLSRELISLYSAHCAGEPPSLSSLPIQFADYAAWQREWLTGPVLADQLAYWRRHLGGALPILELPADRTRPAAPSYEGGWEARRLASTLVTAVETLSHQEHATVFMSLMAAFTALLARYSGRGDVLVGVPIANRNHLASEALIGNLVNTLPIRTDVSGDPTFRELLRSVRSTLLDAYAHQDMPFDRLILELQPERYASHTPLVNVLVNLLNAPMPRRRLAELAWEPFPFDRGAAQFDLSLTVDWRREGQLYLEYSSDVFERTSARRILDHFSTLLHAAVADPDCRLSELSMLTPAEREQLVVTWNRHGAPDPPAASIHGLFEAQADRTPDAVAVIGPDDTLTYRMLEGRANKLARHLRALGVGLETPVGVCFGRSAMTLVALLGVLKAGGAFLSLDPSYPAERLAFMMEDSCAPVLITDAQHAPALMRPGVRVVLLDREWPTIERQSQRRLADAIGGDHLAYVIYTSGSTGTPKGVLGLHRGAVNRFNWMWRTYPFQSGEVCCQKTFDQLRRFDLGDLRPPAPGRARRGDPRSGGPRAAPADRDARRAPCDANRPGPVSAESHARKPGRSGRSPSASQAVGVEWRGPRP